MCTVYIGCVDPTGGALFLVQRRMSLKICITKAIAQLLEKQTVFLYWNVLSLVLGQLILPAYLLFNIKACMNVGGIGIEQALAEQC